MTVITPIAFSDRLPTKEECFVVEGAGSTMLYCWQCKFVSHAGVIRPCWEWRGVPYVVGTAGNWPWTHWLPTHFTMLPVDPQLAHRARVPG